MPPQTSVAPSPSVSSVSWRIASRYSSWVQAVIGVGDAVGVEEVLVVVEGQGAVELGHAVARSVRRDERVVLGADPSRSARSSSRSRSMKGRRSSRWPSWAQIGKKVQHPWNTSGAVPARISSSMISARSSGSGL